MMMNIVKVIFFFFHTRKSYNLKGTFLSFRLDVGRMPSELQVFPVAVIKDIKVLSSL